jgi:hypothetical protein
MCVVSAAQRSRIRLNVQQKWDQEYSGGEAGTDTWGWQPHGRLENCVP